MSTITNRSGGLRKAVAATLLAATVLAGSAGVAAAAKPTKEQEQACWLAYHIMQWAKKTRKAPGDIYDEIAFNAANYIGDHCEDVDLPSSGGPVSRPGPPIRVTVDGAIVTATTTGTISEERLVLSTAPPAGTQAVRLRP